MIDDEWLGDDTARSMPSMWTGETEFVILDQDRPARTPASAIEQLEDTWERQGHLWRRIHRNPRVRVYQPSEGDGGPDLSKIDPVRTTVVIKNGQEIAYEDFWTDDQDPVINDGAPWTGYTIFKEKFDYPQIYEHDGTGEVRQPRAVGYPAEPTPEEKAQHELTHMPFKSWCPICVRCKSKDDQHKQVYDKRPALQAD